jgi:Protein of unknown function (DUF2905)/Beta-propeller repeat
LTEDGLGGSSVDSISAIAVDSSLSAYVTGETFSYNFPYAGYQSMEFGILPSAFLTKLSHKVVFQRTLIAARNEIDSLVNAGYLHLRILGDIGMPASRVLSDEIRNVRIYFPIVTSIILSVLLTLILRLFG